LLQKHGRPTDLKTALRQSAGVDPVAETPSKKSKGAGQAVASGCRGFQRRTPSTCSRHACGLLPSRGTMRALPS
jgi:hypothetical protein